jgi:hypothetical protein
MSLDGVAEGDEFTGPAVVESPFTTVVLEPGARLRKLEGGNLLLTP